MTRHHALAALLLAAAVPAASAADGPAFNCAQVRPGSVPAQVCADAGLSALDRQLDQAYAQARKKAKGAQARQLQAEQRGWIKGRDECWKSEDPPACIRTQYQQRVAELQATYRLLAPTASVRYVCAGEPAMAVDATYFPTEPATVLARRGQDTSLMFAAPSASGAKYQGRNEMLWEHQGEATIQWGFQAPERRCKLQ